MIKDKKQAKYTKENLGQDLAVINENLKIIAQMLANDFKVQTYYCPMCHTHTIVQEDKFYCPKCEQYLWNDL